MPELKPRLYAALIAALLVTGLAYIAPVQALTDGLRISVLSNRADLVSAGDVLVAIALPDGVRPSKVRVSAGSRDVTGAFAVRENGRYEGLVTGLPLGRVTLRATAGGHSDQVTLTNHRNGGPVFSGPQVQPWKCQPGAVDALCNQPPSYTLRYKSTDPLKPGLQPYDPDSPPSDVATTTTDGGVSVPFVVRQETGYADRDQYTILTLFQPGRSWRPWAPQPQWNHKVLVTHGGGCGADYQTGTAPLADYSGTVDAVPGYEQSYVVALGRGFAVMSTALDNNGHNCNPALQAESLIMAKERLVEQYGPIRYTIGTGCSGGALVQQQVANAYPGVYQGLITTCSYPDTLTAGAQFTDYHLMRLYFENPSKWGLGVLWTPTQVAAVEGHLSHLNAVVADEGLFKGATRPDASADGCAGVPAAAVYHPQNNPSGVRCSFLDAMVNVLGRRPESVWSPMERAAGYGFAGLPLGNAGVQYGLDALRQGLITPAQFADLNAKIGGLDVDINPVAARTTGDFGAIARAYRSGAINMANQLSTVAIINHGGPDPGLAHDYSHAFWTRARLEREQGHARNHVMWFGHTPLIGNPGYAVEALGQVDRWLSLVEADHSDKPLAAKIVDDRPSDLSDRCSDLPGLELVTLPGVGAVCDLAPVQTRYGTPRTVAGGPVTNDVTACTLKPLRRADHYPAVFTDADWKALTSAFPSGVCDYGRPGTGQQGAVTWLAYQDCQGSVLYGGQPLGDAPPRSGAGWTSESFASWVITGSSRSPQLGTCS
ncbi:MAG: DUF6351 family protein [Micromonosporaceae bacterium]